MRAAQRFAAGDKTADIAAELRVGVRQVEKWRSAGGRGGGAAVYRAAHARAAEREAGRPHMEAELTRGPRGVGLLEDEAGLSLRPPIARTWGRRGTTPVVRVPVGRGAGKVSTAVLACWRRHRSERQSLSWRGYRDQLVAASPACPAGGSCWSGTTSTSTWTTG